VDVRRRLRLLRLLLLQRLLLLLRLRLLRLLLLLRLRLLRLLHRPDPRFQDRQVLQVLLDLVWRFRAVFLRLHIFLLNPSR
jgi:hypothetical protein